MQRVARPTINGGDLQEGRCDSEWTGTMAKVYFILGCTACGKGALGREIAKRVGGHVVSVDSMKVYRRMDIGTATPTRDQQRDVPHHCIDIVEPSDSFSAARFVDSAEAALTSIAHDGAVALAVGGTSLYIKALSEGLFQAPPGDQAVRDALHDEAAHAGLAALHRQLAAVDPPAAARIHPNDERRIVRALEVYRTTGTPITELQAQWDSGHLRHDCVFVGIRRDKDAQSRRINARVKRMIDAGLKDEVASLLAEPAGLSTQAAAAVGYAEMIAHFRGDLTADQAVERIKINTRRLAKKQRTWHRRWPDVHWFDLADDETASALADRVMASITFAPAGMTQDSET